jgi:hypothetical protein
MAVARERRNRASRCVGGVDGNAATARTAGLTGPTQTDRQTDRQSGRSAGRGQERKTGEAPPPINRLAMRQSRLAPGDHGAEAAWAAQRM